jgi:chemotaxis protein methyltransferase CheR
VASGQTLSLGDYEAFQRFLHEASGIVLGAGKQYLVSSRLNGILKQQGLASVGELLEQLRNGRNSALRIQIIDAMTTNETFWFRDPSHYQLLTDKVLPDMASGGSRPLRVWSAACSSGQEPYTLSMVVQDFLSRNPGRIPAGVEILGTDISTKILEEARKGIYCGWSASRGLSPDQRKRFFLNKDGDECVEVQPQLRQRVRFREINLTKGYELLGRFDVIFCRNVLIYFSNTQKVDIINRMARALNPGGYLFLGSTESLAAHTDLFEMVSQSGGIVYRLKTRA